VAGSTDSERIADLERRLEEAFKEIQALREENARLRRELEEWKRGHRERSKRRSSRAEGQRTGEKQRPGRKRGHPGAQRPVPAPDRHVTYPVPEHCECGGCVDPIDETVATIVQDIPVVRPENVEHVAQVGRCVRCGRRVVAKLPGAVDAGQSIARVQLGPNAQSLIISLRYEHRTPLRGIASILGTWFGIEITAGAVSQLIDRWRERSTGSYAEIEQHVQGHPIVGLDETGLHQDGVGGWAWLARTDDASLFRVELSRGSWVAEQMLGANFQGILCTDFYGVYTARADWKHAYCGAHLIREAKKVAEMDPCFKTERFSHFIRNWYVLGKQAQLGSRTEQQQARNQLDVMVTGRGPWEHPDIMRLCNRIETNFDGITAFLDDPRIPADNNATERDIRPLAVYRRVTGGTRSENGSRSLAHWMSVTQTLHKNGLPLRDYMIDLNDAHRHGRAPPSVFTTH